MLVGSQATPEGSQSDQKYAWTKQWYPIAIAEDLETYRPNAITLLGKKMVIWMDKDNQWRCFDDVCPHRYSLMVVSIVTHAPLDGYQHS